MIKRPANRQSGLEPLDSMSPEAAVRWRLILGAGAEDADPSLSLGVDGAPGDTLGDRASMDRALGFVYSPTPAGSRGDLSRSAPYIPEWLELIRTTFPPDTVSLLIRDALDRQGLSQLLLEPESLALIEPDPALVAALLSLKDSVPEAARTAVRSMVQRLVAKLERSIRHDLTSAARRSALNRRSNRGSYRAIDWPRTVRRNLRHYNTETGRLVPENVYFRAAEEHTASWRLVLLVDQSGSMAQTVIHAAIAASVLASVRSVDTRLVLFGTDVADVSAKAADPVDVLLGAQIGGGTDIAGAVEYAERLVENAPRTLLVLVTDLYEGGDEEALVRRLAVLNESGCRTACVLALNAGGRADYNEALAQRLSSLGTPSFTAAPERLVPLLSMLWAPTWPPEHAGYGA